MADTERKQIKSSKKQPNQNKPSNSDKQTLFNLNEVIKLGGDKVTNFYFKMLYLVLVYHVRRVVSP